MNIPEYIYFNGYGAGAVFIGGAEYRLRDIAELRLNFGITSTDAQVSKEQLDCWLIKLFWLRDVYVNKQNGDCFSRFDVCKRMYGLSYEQVISLSAKEFLGDKPWYTNNDSISKIVDKTFKEELRQGEYARKSKPSDNGNAGDIPAVPPPPIP